MQNNYSKQDKDAQSTHATSELYRSPIRRAVLILKALYPLLEEGNQK